MRQRRFLAILGGAAALVLVGILLLRRGHGAAAVQARPDRAAPAEAASQAEAQDTAASRAEARRARDAMRAEILAALRRRNAESQPAPPARPAAAGPPSSAAPAEGDEPPPGRYEPSYIQQHFREDMFPLMRQCYESALLRRPALAGKLVLSFAIVGDPRVGGIVEDADFAEESDLKDTEMETCVRESLMTLTFDKPPAGGGKVTVKYPVMFSPGDEEPEAGSRAP
jgi:hypothetical protein